MNRIRLIAMDLDGTLLASGGRILPETLRALRAAQARGVTLALASGRYPENAAAIFVDNGLIGPVMGANGAIIQDAPMGQTLFLHMMAKETAMAVREYLDGMLADYIIFSLKRVVTSRVGLTHRSELNDGPRMERLGGIRFGHGPEAVEMALKEGVCKFYVCEHPRLPEMAKSLRNVPGLLVTRSGVNNIELMPAGIHKGHGIGEMAKWLGVPMAEVMAFGDEENDLPMLTAVGFGVAMGNAPEHVRAQCAYATESNEENGIAHAIDRLVLGKGA